MHPRAKRALGRRGNRLVNQPIPRQQRTLRGSDLQLVTRQQPADRPPDTSSFEWQRRHASAKLGQRGSFACVRLIALLPVVVV